EETNGVRSDSEAPGIVYAYRNDEDRIRYLARQILPHADWLSSEDTGSAIAAVVDYMERRGRLPRLEEMPAEMAKLLSHLQPKDLPRIVMKSAAPQKIEAVVRASTLYTPSFPAVALYNARD